MKKEVKDTIIVELGEKPRRTRRCKDKRAP